jgi:peptidoglycan/xylan/chitin deacetylase (PgdA/CDA1 family)
MTWPAMAARVCRAVRLGVPLGGLSPAVAGSAALHLAGASALVAAPELWHSVLGTLAFNHAALAIVGAVPGSRLLGPNLIRLTAAARARGEVVLTFDDGPDPHGTPRVIDILARHGATASFFCIGSHAARDPGLTREIAARGHSVENHTFRHSNGFAFLGPRGLAAEISRAQETLTALSGRKPSFFRAPMGVRGPLLEPVLRRLDLSLVSWTRRGLDGLPADPRRVRERLTRDLAAGDILVLHDGGPAGGRVAIQVLPWLLEAIAVSGLRPVSLAQATAPRPDAAAAA